MELVRNKLLLLFLVYVSGVLGRNGNEINARKSEEICMKLTEQPFFTHEFIYGTWRTYYTWGKMIRRCESIKIKPVSDTTKERFADRAGSFFEESPDWFDAELMIVIGNRTGLARKELLLFAEGNVRGRYKALVNPRTLGLSPPQYGIKFMKLAFKGFDFFKYLVLINCSLCSGWLMARPDDTTVTIKEVMAVVDSVNIGLEGQFSCLP